MRRLHKGLVFRLSAPENRTSLAKPSSVGEEFFLWQLQFSSIKLFFSEQLLVLPSSSAVVFKSSSLTVPFRTILYFSSNKLFFSEKVRVSPSTFAGVIKSSSLSCCKTVLFLEQFYFYCQVLVLLWSRRVVLCATVSYRGLKLFLSEQFSCVVLDCSSFSSLF